MKPDLQGQVVLITGGGRGLGRHVAQHLAACGANVGIADIDAANCHDTVASITATGQKAYAFTGDISDQKVFLKIVDDLVEQTGRIDAIINNAMLLKYSPVTEVADELLSSMLDVGIKAPFWAAQGLLKHLNKERGACMINMSSPVVNRGYPNTSAYTAVKGAIAALTRVLAAELGPQGIRVNAVSPASVPTPGALGMVTQEEYQRRARTIPLRRIGTEEDNSNAIAFLLSQEASFVNGEIFNVDGGASAAAG